MKQQTLHYITLHVPVGTDDNTRTIHTHLVIIVGRHVIYIRTVGEE